MLLQTGVLEFGSVFHLSAEFLSLGSRSLARPIYSWSKHGYSCIYLPLSEDLAICMDVELNCGAPLAEWLGTWYLSLSF